MISLWANALRHPAFQGFRRLRRRPLRALPIRFAKTIAHDERHPPNTSDRAVRASFFSLANDGGGLDGQGNYQGDKIMSEAEVQQLRSNEETAKMLTRFLDEVKRNNARMIRDRKKRQLTLF
jgi:hypothetical protein